MSLSTQKHPDLLCFSHLRWNFVFQRPQHLMSRFAKKGRVFFIEEPIFDAPSRYNEIYEDPNSNVTVVTPHIPTADERLDAERALLDMLFVSRNITEYISWYYSPLFLEFTSHLKPIITVYDCMDELSAFKFASPLLKDREAELFKKADLVFTGGNNLFEAKKHLHQNIHPFPSGIDKSHFIQAREFTADPPDQANIPHPRIGFYGVIDERFNLSLLTELAEKKPDWHFVIIGPTAKIDPASLPKKSNIHFPGGKDYKELPAYLGGWDIAFMPFELNEATKYISPTKTPEFLAAGKPVVSTSIHDVIHPYKEKGLVEIADTADEFFVSIQKLLDMKNKNEWLKKVDEFLPGSSWNKIWHNMDTLIEETIQKKTFQHTKKTEAYV
jgi:glycosyltransferase involved in cell wall biosynthesis